MKKLILLLLLTLFVPNVKAETTNFTLGNKIEGEYVRKTLNGEKWTKSMTFLRRTSDGRITYCVEPWEHITTYDLEKKTGKEAEALGYTEELWDKLRLTAYYGYGYQNHTSDIWYSVTQFLLSKYPPLGMYITYTNTLDGAAINKHTAEITELENLVKNHYQKPSFTGTTKSLEVYGTININDNYGVIGKYEIKETKLVDAVISGNTLKVTALGEKGVGQVTLIKQDRMYNEKSTLYHSDTSQDFMTVGSYEPVEAVINFNIKGSSLIIKQTDKVTGSTVSSCNRSLEGATYTLTTPTGVLVDTITIKNNLIGTSKPLAAGNYNLYQETPPFGYYKNNSQTGLTITQGKDLEVVLNNACITKEISVTKYYDDNGLLKKEPNVLFQVIENDRVFNETRTNEEGIARFILPIGEFSFKQVNTMSGYDLIENFAFAVTEQTESGTNYDFVNKKLPIIPEAKEPEINKPDVNEPEGPPKEPQEMPPEEEEKSKEIAPPPVVEETNNQTDLVSESEETKLIIEKAEQNLAVGDTIENPRTGDNIFRSLFLSLGSLTGIIILLFKKKC